MQLQRDLHLAAPASWQQRVGSHARRPAAGAGAGADASDAPLFLLPYRQLVAYLPPSDPRPLRAARRTSKGARGHRHLVPLGDGAEGGRGVGPCVGQSGAAAWATVAVEGDACCAIDDDDHGGCEVEL